MPAIDVTRGAPLRCLRSLNGNLNEAAVTAERTEIALRVPADWNRLIVMSALATGYLPWGEKAFPNQKTPCLSLKSGRYPVAACYAFTIETAQTFVDAGLLGPAEGSGEALVITETGRMWLLENWHRHLSQPIADQEPEINDLFLDAQHAPRPMRGRGRSVTGSFRR
ncbi:hypothetical protein ACW7BJ_27410 [Azospirillum argentinense]